MYGYQTVRTILAAPSVGAVAGSFGYGQMMLDDRIANGHAFPGEHVVRVPRRFVRYRHQRWLLAHGRVTEAANYPGDWKG